MKMSYSERSDEGSDTISHTVCFYLRPETHMINLSYSEHVQSPDFQLFQN